MMSYSLAEDRSLTGPGPWTLDYWPADPRGNHVQCFMWALWGVCVCVVRIQILVMAQQAFY